MSAKRDYSKYNITKIQKQIEINRKVKIYDFISCCICGKMTAKYDHRKVVCESVDCRNILAALRNYNHLPKANLKSKEGIKWNE